MNASLSIIGIGGGGFTHGVDPDLDSFVLGKCQTPKPRIGFVATASGDDPVRVEKFYTRFADEPCTPTHMRSDWPAHEIRRWIAAQDLIYVGGGNTSTMLGSWAQWGLPQLFRGVSSRGMLLAGVSAGAVCWFEAALSDSVGPTLGPLKGLGFIGGSCCPHYSEDPERRPAFKALVASGALPGGVAIDDGVGVHFENGKPVEVFSARPGAGAHLVSNTGTGVVSTELSNG